MTPELRAEGLHPAEWQLTAPGPVGVCAKCGTDLYPRSGGQKYCRLCAVGKEGLLLVKGAPMQGQCARCGDRIPPEGKRTLYCSASCAVAVRNAMRNRRTREYMRERRVSHPALLAEQKRQSALRHGWTPAIRHGFCQECGAPFVARGSAATEGSPNYRRFCGTRCAGASWEEERKRRQGGKKHAGTGAAHPTLSPLPGGLLRFTLAPSIFRASESGLQRAVALHGVLSVLLSRGHRRVADFALWQGRESWSVFFYDRQDAARFSGESVSTQIRDGLTTIRFEKVRTLYAQDPFAAGEYRVTVETREPLVTSSDGHTRVADFSPLTVQALALGVAERLGLAHEGPVCSEVESRLQEATRYVGGHGGRGDSRKGYVLCRVGKFVARVNARCAWLMHCGARVGLGGDTSRGFGRVSVTVEAI